jgi:predicted secreted protein
LLLSGQWDNSPVADEAQHEVVDLRVGDEHVVRLAGRGTAGYRWAPGGGHDESVAAVSEREIPGPMSDAAGASGDEVFRVRALAPGSTRIVFAQRRPWEGGDAAPNREHVVELRVTD